MIWQRVNHDEVVAVTALHSRDKSDILRLQMQRLGRLLDGYYGGYATYQLKSADRLFDDPRDRQDYRGGVLVQVFINSWHSCLESIPKRQDLGLRADHQVAAMLYHKINLQDNDETTIAAIAAKLQMSKSGVWKLLQGYDYSTRQWPYGKPGVNDYLVACNRVITAHEIEYFR